MSEQVVLVYEPNVRLRGALELTLRRLGYDVLLAGDQETAESICLEKQPQLAIFSCEPTQQGSGSLELCLSLVQAKTVDAAVMVASRPTRDMVLTAMRAGALEFVVRPATAQHLAEKLERASARAVHATTVAREFEGLDFGVEQRTVEERVDIIAAQAATLRAMPHVVGKVLRISETGRSGALELAKVVESDPAIAAVILKRVRGSDQKTSAPIADLKQAVVRLGFRETRKTVLGMSIVSLIGGQEKTNGLHRTWHWLHSLACGVLSQWICRQVRLPDADLSFLAGLLHDVGKVFLDDFLGSEYCGAVDKAKSQGISLYDAECAVLQRNHATLGASIVDAWGFPSGVGHAIGDHHNHDQFTHDEPLAPTLSGVVYLANQLAKSLLIGSGGDFVVQRIPTSVWESYGFVDSNLDALISDVSSELKNSCRFLGINASKLGLERSHHAGRAMVVCDEATVPLSIHLALLGRGYRVETSTDVDRLNRESGAPSICVLCANDLNATSRWREMIGTELPVVIVLSKQPVAADGLGDLPSNTTVFTWPLDFYQFGKVATEARHAPKGVAALRR